jgi:membrane fusion protein (multidrug efflux system)
MGQDHSTTHFQNGRRGLKRTKHRLWLTAAFCFFTVMLLFLGTARAQEEAGKSKPAANARPVMLVEAAQAEIMSANREITAIGTLNSNEAVVIATEIGGRITEIAFTEGQQARGGQVLVRLDRSILEAQRDRAEASLTLSRANRERSDILFKDAAISQREWDAANAQWQLDEANLRLAQAQLDKTVLRAPFDGALGLRHVSVGEYVQPGHPIVTLDDTDPLKGDFRVPEAFSSSLRVGQTVQLQVDAAPGRVFSGQVYAIDPKVDAAGRNLLVRARVPNGDRSLRPGMFAQVRLVIEEKPNALMIPEQALISRGGSQIVYKVVDGKVEEAVVTVGLRRRGQVEITEGLSPGDTVITAGQIKVRPGSSVKVASTDGEN